MCSIKSAATRSSSAGGDTPSVKRSTNTPRKWVHVQNKEDRHVRSGRYILNNKNQLRPVVKVWEKPAPSNQNANTKEEEVARKTLQAVFDDLNE